MLIEKMSKRKCKVVAIQLERSRPYTYMHLEDEYTKDAKIIFSQSEKHSGGGRYTFARSLRGTDNLEEMIWDPKYTDTDTLAEDLWGFIQETYCL